MMLMKNVLSNVPLDTISVTFEVYLLWAFKTLLQPFLSLSFSLYTYSW